MSNWIDSELIQNQNCYEPCETEFKMMTDFALEIAFAVFIIQFPNILHFLIILIITELRGTLSWSGLSCDGIQMLWFDTRSSRHSSSSSSTPHSAAAGWLEFLNWIWCLTFESSGSSAVLCTMVLMLNSGVKAPLPYQLSMAMAILFAHFLSCFSLAMADTMLWLPRQDWRPWCCCKNIESLLKAEFSCQIFCRHESL